jgi:hypothetical protein
MDPAENARSAYCSICRPKPLECALQEVTISRRALRIQLEVLHATVFQYDQLDVLAAECQRSHAGRCGTSSPIPCGRPFQQMRHPPYGRSSRRPLLTQWYRHQACPSSRPVLRPALEAWRTFQSCLVWDCRLESWYFESTSSSVERKTALVDVEPPFTPTKPPTVSSFLKLPERTSCEGIGCGK